MSGKTARRLRKEREQRSAQANHASLQAKAVGAAAATMLAMSVAPGVALAEEDAAADDAATPVVAEQTVVEEPVAQAENVSGGG